MNPAMKKHQRRATDVDAAVAERIRAYRRVRMLSQSELADKLGVTFQQVQKYEKGTNRICAGRLYELAKILDIPVQALFPDERDSTSQTTGDRTDEVKKIANFAVSADGWRLCQAFLGITDPKRRKSIISLVQELKES